VPEDLKLPKIIVICGPTGVGKTGFAIDLAQRYGGQIVGADSMQIYRFMDVGTAKPTTAEQAAVKHHLVDIADPRHNFDAAEFASQAHGCIAGLLRDNILPFVTGGTGLYIKALLHGLSQAAPSDPAVRNTLRRDLRETGTAALHRRLAKVDAPAARRIHPNDSYRVIRALEVHAIAGRPLSHYQEAHGFSTRRYDALQIGLSLPREELYERIDRRVEMMLAQGLVEEVRGLLAKGYPPSLKAMQSLGYRHMVDLIQGRMDREAAVRLMKRDHRRYAKRQMTWFRADARVRWLSPDQIDAAARMISTFLNLDPSDDQGKG
jgi:tRNA dimethylallyltransferase